MEISKINRWSLEYIYMTVMVIYMGMMTINTASMVTYSPQMDTFAIILPVILNVALIVKHKINFSNKGLIRILCFCLVWLLCGAPDKPCGRAVQMLTQKHVAKRYMIAKKVVPLHYESEWQYKHV